MRSASTANNSIRHLAGSGHGPYCTTKRLSRGRLQRIEKVAPLTCERFAKGLQVFPDFHTLPIVHRQ
jgi:hypothetical protein